jgi:hypothetical protein
MGFTDHGSQSSRSGLGDYGLLIKMAGVKQHFEGLAYSPTVRFELGTLKTERKGKKIQRRLKKIPTSLALLALPIQHKY